MGDFSAARSWEDFLCGLRGREVRGSHICDSREVVEVWGGLRLHSQAEPSAGDRTREKSVWFCAGSKRVGRSRIAPELPPRIAQTHPRPVPGSTPAKNPQQQHGLLHRERLLQARRRHSRHPAGRSRCQRGRCQNPGEFPGPHGEEEDKERRARPEGPGPRGAGRSWGRARRRGRRSQRRLGQN